MAEPGMAGGRARRWLLGVGLLAAVAGAYANAVPNEFVFDDQLLIVEHRAVRAPLTAWRSLRSYRPLRTLSYRLDYAIAGMDPRMFHLSNVLYHGLTVLTVRALLEGGGASPWAAAAGALLFAVHPVQTDAVTYAAGRRDVLCGLFFAAGFLAYLRYRRNGHPAALLVAGIAYVLALLVKEMAVTLPLVCLAYDRFDARRAAGAGRAPRRLLAVALALGGLAAFAVAYGRFIERVLATTAWHGGSIGANVATVARVWLHYLTLVLWPATLSADYSYRAFPPSAGFLDPRALAAAAVFALLAWVAHAAWGRGQLPGFGAAWWGITLLPVSQIVPYHELLAEHYLYLPMMGVAFVIAGIVDALRAAVPERRRALAAAVLAVAAVATLRTVVRNRDWRDAPSLWSATVAAVPECARAHYNLGQAYFERVQFAAAEREFLAAEAIKPDDVDVMVALATLYYRTGKLEQARVRIDAALARRPERAKVQTLAGWITLDRGDPQGALAYFDAALPGLRGNEAVGVQAGRERAQALLTRGRQQGAVRVQ